MNWQDIAKSVAGFAPMLSGVLAATGVGAPVAAAVGLAGKLVSDALGVPNTPDAVAAAMQTDPEAGLKLAAVEATHGENMQALANAAAAKALDAASGALSTVNATMQVEDKTRLFSWRDFWGYVSGCAFAFVVAIVGLIVWQAVGVTSKPNPELMAAIPSIVGAFSTLFGIAAVVLGVQSSIETHHAGMADRIAAGQTTP